MPNALRITLAVLAGLVVGMLLNGGLIAIGSAVVPPPPGADLTTVEGLRAAMPLLGPKHFAVPFLAHALGTLVGAAVSSVMVVSNRKVAAYVVGVAFLGGGIAASVMIPAPTWFKALDLIAAYLPMAWLGLRIANRIKPAGA